MIHYAILPGRYAAAIVPTRRGWRCRSTLRNVLCHDYISGETIGNVCAWLRLLPHHADVLVTADREEAYAALMEDAGTFGDRRPAPCLAPCDQAERILTHIETGW